MKKVLRTLVIAACAVVIGIGIGGAGGPDSSAGGAITIACTNPVVCGGGGG
jgi:hypothetical protein